MDSSSALNVAWPGLWGRRSERPWECLVTFGITQKDVGGNRGIGTCVPAARIQKGSERELERGVAQHVVDGPEPGAVKRFAVKSDAVNRTDMAMGIPRIENQLHRVSRTKESMIIARLLFRESRQELAVSPCLRVARVARIYERWMDGPCTNLLHPLGCKDAHAWYAIIVNAAISSQSSFLAFARARRPAASRSQPRIAIIA